MAVTQASRSEGEIGPLVAWPNTVAPTSPIPARAMAAANHFSCCTLGPITATEPNDGGRR